MFFPFEVCLIPRIRAFEDDTMELLSENGAPGNLSIYLGKEIMDSLPTSIIIDFQAYKDIKLLFIPVIPRPLSEYQFDSTFQS